jgi:transcriptional regulator GlxA family with amidase domain
LAKNDFPRAIDFFIFDGISLMDVAGPAQAFDNARLGGEPAYTHRYLSLDGKPVCSSSGLRLVADGALAEHRVEDDLLIPGGEGVDRLLDDPEVRRIILLQDISAGKGRLISVCSGALLLAAAGVLDDRSATTHWSRSHMARTLYPKVNWALDTIYTKSEYIYTSAGVSSGIDLAMAIIQQDCGPKAALEVAQELVVYLRRTGGQSQFSDLLRTQFSLEDPISKLVEKVTSEPTRDWRLETLAEEVGMSVRTMSRRFNASFGVSPAQFVERARLNYATTLLNKGVPIKQVAAKSGFGELQRMRRSFKRHLGLSASEYMDRFSADLA